MSRYTRLSAGIKPSIAVTPVVWLVSLLRFVLESPWALAFSLMLMMTKSPTRTARVSSRYPGLASLKSEPALGLAEASFWA